ncbi:guanylate cyclase soluble subunit beta-2-like isoform X4 [Cervus elaphus]|uniref:guanylate cyclase soluble subunit beta-2-like isoform X4 n=1 Tax=Cervus elaphus TaxID=9860 RepID=UPI001CC27CD7|nr:guanylate cyclase soluble subunit beta-2-like isoform X4 [Cervus elaphus]
MHFSEGLFPGARHLWKKHEWNLVFHLAGTCILRSTGVSMEAILKLFGEYFFKFCKMSGYDRMLRTLGGNLTEFIENLDALHSYLAHSYQEMNAPSFRVERGAEGKMLLHYYSDRSGLCHIVPGIIEAVAKDFFDTDMTMDILDVNQEEERMGKKEHVVFLIVQKSHGQMRRAKPKGSQDGQDSQRDQETPEAAFLRMKEKYLSVSTHAVKKSRWEVVRNIVMFKKGSAGCRSWRMHVSDTAPHDPTRDLILLNRQRLAEIELSKQLERKEEELRVLSTHLAAEKKTEASLYAMLPEHVANQLKEGRKVATGEFKTCTILFSDVVTFTNICAACEPIQIVNMLNSMYSKFDRLTSVHEVYKVETIGDAYMVVGGVPVPVRSHAQRVANFALGLRISAKEVMNPVTGEPIQIRVGIHMGPVLAGVVGDKMPRYCSFGDTVNTASRMESHGLPNKVHLSPTTYRALKNQGFEITEQGEIEVKGKGKMTTYFLIRNLKASEDEIMGKPQAWLDSAEASDQGSRDGKTLALMRYEDSWHLPKGDTAHASDWSTPKGSPAEGREPREAADRPRPSAQTETCSLPDEPLPSGLCALL